MHIGTVLSIGSEQVIMVGGFVIQVILVWIAIYKFRQAARDKIDEKLKEKADKEFVANIKRELAEKIQTNDSFNTKSHMEMISTMKSIERRNEDQHRELKEDYLRGLNDIKGMFDKMWDRLNKMN